jgi:hypothetical protein
MNPTETADYITQHLNIAGRADNLFSADAITLIHNASRGYPRAVYNLAVNAPTAAFARHNPIIDEKPARTAISETGADCPRPALVTKPRHRAGLSHTRSSATAMKTSSTRSKTDYALGSPGCPTLPSLALPRRYCRDTRASCLLTTLGSPWGHL